MTKSKNPKKSGVWYYFLLRSRSLTHPVNAERRLVRHKSSGVKAASSTLIRFTKESLGKYLVQRLNFQDFLKGHTKKSKRWEQNLFFFLFTSQSSKIGFWFTSFSESDFSWKICICLHYFWSCFNWIPRTATEKYNILADYEMQQNERIKWDLGYVLLCINSVFLNLLRAKSRS